MNCDTPEPETRAIRQAARGFTRGLAERELLALIARVEATVAIGGAGSVFTVDEALAAVWPPSLGAPPQREIIWAQRRDGDGQAVTLSAFDTAGRLLLRRTYPAAGRRKAGAPRHV